MFKVCAKNKCNKVTELFNEKKRHLDTKEIYENYSSIEDLLKDSDFIGTSSAFSFIQQLTCKINTQEDLNKFILTIYRNNCPVKEKLDAFFDNFKLGCFENSSFMQYEKLFIALENAKSHSFS